MRRIVCIYLFDKGRVVAKETLDEIKKNFKFACIWREYGPEKEM